MNYYLEKISKTQQQLDIAKAGFTQVANGYIQDANRCADGVDYDYAKEMTERLNAGLDLIKELESQIKFLRGKLIEEQAKENGNASED